MGDGTRTPVLRTQAEASRVSPPSPGRVRDSIAFTYSLNASLSPLLPTPMVTIQVSPLGKRHGRST